MKTGCTKYQHQVRLHSSLPIALKGKNVLHLTRVLYLTNTKNPCLVGEVMDVITVIPTNPSNKQFLFF